MQAANAILLVEDDPGDVQLIRRAFDAIHLDKKLIIVPNGQEAASYVNGVGRYADRKQFPLPELILLDLDLPHVNGFEFLLWLRERSEQRQVPVIVLTGSVFSSVLQTAYSLGANSFLTKPLEMENFIAAIRQTCDFWLGQYQPPQSGPGLDLEAR